MTKKFLIGLILFASGYTLQAQINFEDYFNDKTLRIDYIIGGNCDTEKTYFKQIKEEKYWGGSLVNLIDTFNYGEYKVSVYDSTSNKLIYSRGYCSLFEEWQATEEAKNIDKSFYETVVVPYPKNTINVVIESRNKENIFIKVFSKYISPENQFIVKNGTRKFPSEKIVDSGNHHEKLDLVFIAEGYAKNEINDFKKDVNIFVNSLFSESPFKENKNNLNIWIVESISEESGTDIPNKNIWKNTILNSNFYTFYSDRYLTTTDIKSVRDIASNVPYDQIVILVNTEKYGGGGIYNYWSLFAGKNKQAQELFLHEFGHAFAGLADEYFTSGVSVEEYYSKNIEPWQPNITSLVDFNKKWKKEIKTETPIPTPILDKNKNTIGVYEGAGYVAKNMYRPFISCKMKVLDVPFCPVCNKAITNMINFYAK